MFIVIFSLTCYALLTARAPGPTDRKKQHSSVISAFRARNINLPKALPVTRKPSSCSYVNLRDNPCRELHESGAIRSNTMTLLANQL